MRNSERRTECARKAALILERDPLILDTETTGLTWDAQVVQIAVINCQGEALFESLVRPTIPISPGATRIHGIGAEQVADAPSFADLHNRLHTLLSNRTLAGYNLDFDLNKIEASALANGRKFTAVYPLVNSYCVMRLFAAFYGQWNDYHHDYRFQTLDLAVRSLNCTPDDAAAHSALGDARRTLAVLKAIAEYQEET